MAGKDQIVDAAAANLDGATKASVSAAFDAIFGAISDSLTNGEAVQVPKFGKFEVRERAARQGRNPQTGETITIKASRAAGFKASKNLKDALNG